MCATLLKETPEILIIEDNVSICETLRLLFQITHLQAVCTETAQEALSILRQFTLSPRLVLVDRRLPDADGLDLVKILRNILPPSTDIYLFSADQIDEETTQSCGATGLIRKPFHINELLDLASRYKRVA